MTGSMALLHNDADAPQKAQDQSQPIAKRKSGCKELAEANMKDSAGVRLHAAATEQIEAEQAEAAPEHLKNKHFPTNPKK